MALNTKGKKSRLAENAFIYEKRTDGISEKQRWKGLSRHEKKAQFKDYYLRPLLITIAIILTGSYFLYHDFILRKEVVYQSAIINEAVLQESLEAFSQNYISFIKEDFEKKNASFQTFFLDPKLATAVGTTVATDLQHLSAQLYSKTLDSIIIGKNIFPVYFEKGIYADLDTILSPEERKALEDFLYIPEDRSLNPSQKAYGIHLKNSPIYQSIFQKDQEHWVEEPLLVITNTSPRKELSKKFIYYLFPNVLS